MDAVPAPTASKRLSRRPGKFLGPRQPVQHVLNRQSFNVDKYNEIHLTTCVHEPFVNAHRPRIYLHLHNRALGPTRDSAKSAAMGVKKLTSFIETLQAIHTEMLAHASSLTTENLPGA